MLLNWGKQQKKQYAVKHTSAIDQVVSKRYVIDHHQSKRRCFALESSDLEGCYDIIVHTAAAMALLLMLRSGQTDRPLNMQLNTAVIITVLRMLQPVRIDSQGSRQLCTPVIITVLLRHLYWLNIAGSTPYWQVPYYTLPIQPFICHIGKQQYNNITNSAIYTSTP